MLRTTTKNILSGRKPNGEPRKSIGIISGAAAGLTIETGCRLKGELSRSIRSIAAALDITIDIRIALADHAGTAYIETEATIRRIIAERSC